MPLPVAAPAPKVVGVGEIADALGTTKQTVYVHIRAGRIPSSRVGLKYFVPRAWLNAVLAGEDPREWLESTNLDAEALLALLDAFHGSGADKT